MDTTSSDLPATTRRKALAGMGIGLGTLVASPVFAGQGGEEKNAEPVGLIDPRTKYPAPPFKEQSQPWPGLASKMDPQRIAILVGRLSWPVR